MPAAMAYERLELRPNWLTLAGLLYVTAMGFLVATTVCLTSKQKNATGYRHLPWFGPSRAYMVGTLNCWLERFAPTPPRS